MDMVGGPLGVIVIAVVAALAVLLAVLHFGFHVFRRRKGKVRHKSSVTGDSRVEVLETTIIDSERRLVLIRCDRIEHLIMIGGPADVVVENDVRKVRGAGASPATIPGMEPEKRTPPATQRAAPPPAAAREAVAQPPKALEPPRTFPSPVEGARQAPAPSRSPPPIQPPSARNGGRNGDVPAPVPPIRADERRPSGQRPQPVESKPGQRDATPARRTPQTTPVSRGNELLRATPAAPANDRSARPAKAGGRPEPSPAVPPAQIPWTDQDSIENEIVRALRVDPQTRGDQTAGRGQAPSPKAMVDSATTLGDLADRLEEALAREVQSASQHRSAPETVDFGFDNEAPAAEPERPSAKPAPPTKPAPEKERQDKRPEPPARAVPAAEAEPKREPPAPPERREEAPVISLSSRRRESADQLEDEMARLLGELTSDTKGR